MNHPSCSYPHIGQTCQRTALTTPTYYMTETVGKSDDARLVVEWMLPLDLSEQDAADVMQRFADIVCQLNNWFVDTEAHDSGMRYRMDYRDERDGDFTFYRLELVMI